MMTDDLLKQGMDALEAGHKAKARELLTRAVEHDERNEAAWLWLSGAVDTDEERCICLENALTINPKNEMARRGLTLVLGRAGVRPVSAAPSPTPTAEPADSDGAIELDLDDAAAYIERGNARANLNDLDGAIADFTRAIALDPDSATAYHNRGIVRGTQGDLDGAIADFGRAIELRPEYAGAYAGRGLAHREHGNVAAALADLGRYLELRPDAHNREMFQERVAELEAQIAGPSAPPHERPTQPREKTWLEAPTHSRWTTAPQAEEVAEPAVPPRKSSAPPGATMPAPVVQQMRLEAQRRRSRPRTRRPIVQERYLEDRPGCLTVYAAFNGVVAVLVGLLGLLLVLSGALSAALVIFVALLYFLLARGLWQQKNWARIITVILIGLQVVPMILSDLSLSKVGVFGVVQVYFFLWLLSNEKHFD